jgi:hypothetical protein
MRYSPLVIPLFSGCGMLQSFQATDAGLIAGLNAILANRGVSVLSEINLLSEQVHTLCTIGVVVGVPG